jgi:unsaturated chondroitin disaccharide hydrolase
MFEDALVRFVDKLALQTPKVGMKIPAIGDANFKWTFTDPSNWVSGFFSGQLVLAFALTGRSEFADAARTRLAHAEAILRQPATQNHDLGFQFVPSCVHLFKLTRDDRCRALALRAADILRSRFHYNGMYIQAWTPAPHMSAARRAEIVGKAIADTMMNLPLLFWATEETGDPSFAEVACMHAETTRRYIVRPDGSSFHHFKFDPFDGEPLGGMTGQGYANESCWSRGQAWLLYGFALACSKTEKVEYLATASALARYVKSHLPPDKIPLWDYAIPNPAASEPIDSSAAAITASALYLLAEQPGMREWMDLAGDMLCAIVSSCDLGKNAQADGMLAHGAAHVPAGKGDAMLPYGDFFYLEALMRSVGHRDFAW